ncbi:MAG TPA: outer membrane lipoprotein carrier protein LolA [Aliidongia sp.]|nr:outer membrane lipoprotein carrier protein LolA [Aliidongia sp.]
MTRRAFAGGALLLLAAQRALAAPASLPAADQAELQQIEAYLNGIKTLKAKFQQTAADGAVSGGTVWLSRPGKMRLDYDPPAKLQLVANDGLVAVNDLTVEQVQYISIDETAAWFLLRDKITLTGDVTVTRFERGPKTVRVTATQTKDSSIGSLTLLLTEDPLALRQWTVLDAQGKNVTVALTEVQDGITLANSLFELPNKLDRSPRPH